jgi:glycosyltransferase involved in cell wall biosynthesis
MEKPCGRGRAIIVALNFFEQGVVPMRIVTVLTSLGVGGAEKQALAVAERMAGRGHAVAIIVLRPHLPEEWPTTLPVVHLDIRKNPASVAAGFRRGRHFLREFRPDVVHSHSFHANILARLMAIGTPRAAVVSTVHNVYEGGWMRMMAYRLTDELSQRTVAVSEVARERFVRAKAVSPSRCLVVRIGIDVEEFAPDAARRARMRTELHAAEGAPTEFVWLAAGRVAPAKDYPNLLRAFRELEKRQSGAQLWIAGGGTAAEFADLESHRHALGIRGRVLWLGLRRDLPALLDAADGFVLASAWEGMPQVIAEAMAMEKPVVATDVGGVRELVGDAGTLVPAKDPQALAETMQATMRRSGEERTQLGRAARERILSQFSIDAAADWWEGLYKQGMGSSP